jgi:hypothetical protein
MSEKPRVTIKGNINAANVNTGEQTFHGAVTFTFNGAPAASEDVYETLKAQLQELADALAQSPADKARDVKEVQIAAEDALAEAEKPQPDKGRLEIRGDKLRECTRFLQGLPEGCNNLDHGSIGSIEINVLSSFLLRYP